MKKTFILFPVIALIMAGCSLPSKTPNNLTGQNTGSNDNSAQNAVSNDENNKTPVQETAINPTTTDEKKADNYYSLSSYPYSESVVYKGLSKRCLSDDRIDLAVAKDYKLLKNGAEIILLSLKEVIKNYDLKHNISSCYESDLEIISVSKDGDYLYLNSNYASTEGREHVAGDLSSVYRLDLKNLSLDLLAFIESKSGIYAEQNKVLSDGNRLVWWDLKGVNLFDMKSGTNKVLYSFSGNEWPLASATDSTLSYNIKVNEQAEGQGQVIINLYNKSLTEDDYPIKGDAETFNLYVDHQGWDASQAIKPKFIRQISISIPE